MGKHNSAIKGEITTQHHSPKAEVVVQGTFNCTFNRATATDATKARCLSKFCSIIIKFELQLSLCLVWNHLRAIAVSGNSKSLEAESEHHVGPYVHQHPCRIWLQWRTPTLITNRDSYQSLDNLKPSFLPIGGNGWELHMFSDQDP
jgi:hypothetical protein